MDGFSSWFKDNWFNIVQTLGILAGLRMTAAAANREAEARKRDAHAREIMNIITLAEHHRDLWRGITEKPELRRIFKTDADVAKFPPTLDEELAINEAITHYMTGWRVATAGGVTTLEELGKDIRWFLSLPLPAAVWKKNSEFKNLQFVEFVNHALEATTPLRPPRP